LDLNNTDDKMTDKETHDRVPEGIYLCQVSETVSCGACCGLYNVADASRENLVNMLRERTDAFSNLPRDMEAILAFGEDIENRTRYGRPFPEFHHCPFIGLIGAKKSRVGCLLHPRNPINQGIDYRGLSYYGGLACDVYFCPSSRLLSPVVKRLILAAAEDWYAYGMVITEEKLLTRLFDHVEKGLKRPLTEKELHRKNRYHNAVREVISLKCDWPHRPGTAPAPCHYFFTDRRYPKPPVHYACGCTESPFHDIFYELISRFDSPESQKAAEETLQRLIDRLIAVFAP
jgi:hypothetical protein